MKLPFRCSGEILMRRFVCSPLVILLSAGLSLACGGGGSASSEANPSSTPLPVLPVATHARPSIFWVSQPVNPGETMLITAGDVDASAQAELGQLPDEDPGTPSVRVPSPAAWNTLPSLTATSRSLSATVPASMSAGVYALRVQRGSEKSAILRVNAPDPWFVQGDLGDAATPGGFLTVAGVNLERPGGYEPKAVLVQKGTLTVVAALSLKDRLTTTQGYALRFNVPASTAEGAYELWLHNGRGGADGWVKFSSFITSPLETVSVKKATPWPTTVFAVTQQTGATDDEKFAKALALADANGGGRLYVPAGTYVLTQPLVMPHRTVLYGAGRNVAFLRWDVNPTSVTGLVMGKAMASATRGAFAIEDLSLESTHVDYNGPVVDRSFNKDAVAFRRLRIASPRVEVTGENKRYGIFLRQTANTRLEELVIDSDKCLFTRDSVSYLSVTGCQLLMNNVGIEISSENHNLVIAGNTIEMAGPGAAGASLNPTNFFGKSPYTRDLLFAGNTITQAAGQTSNDTGYTLDGSDGIYLGGIKSVNGTTLNLDGTTTATDRQGKAITYAYTGGIAMILDGRGAGQWRYLTQATQGASSVTVDRAWDIEPDATSTVSLACMMGRYLMVDNDYVREGQHDDYYLTLDSIKAGNTFGMDGRAFAATVWTGRHYQGTVPAWHYQMLGNTLARGPQANLISNIYNEPASSYTRVVAASHVYRNNANTSAGTLNIRLTSDAGGFSDALIEGNQTSSIVLRRWDAAKKRNETTAYSGVLLRNNVTPQGAASTVESLGSLPAGVTVIP